ncbi:hypothetical protein D7Y39_15105 [Stenotrophomonas maltophilia]|nr:hypothetical protein [Stenotrophomonas maltophilia]
MLLRSEAGGAVTGVVITAQHRRRIAGAAAGQRDALHVIAQVSVPGIVQQGAPLLALQIQVTAFAGILIGLDAFPFNRPVWGHLASGDCAVQRRN